MKRLSFVKLHLTANPLAVKVCIPPAALILPGRIVLSQRLLTLLPGITGPAGHHHLIGSNKRDAKVPMLAGRNDRFPRIVSLLMSSGARGRLLHHNVGRPDIIVKCGVLLLVLGLPGVVDLQSAVELLPAGLQQLNITGGVDGVPQLRILPLAQVKLLPPTAATVDLQLAEAVLQAE